MAGRFRRARPHYIARILEPDGDLLAVTLLDLDSDRRPTEIFRRDQRRTATSERIEDYSRRTLGEQLDHQRDRLLIPMDSSVATSSTV